MIKAIQAAIIGFTLTLCIVLGILGLIAVLHPAGAAEIDLIGGVTHASAPPAGTWWEPGQAHQFALTSPSFGVGLGGQLTGWSRWHVAYENLGASHTSAIACAADEPACYGKLHERSLPFSNWYGRERPQGLWATWEPSYGHMFLQLGGGAYVSQFSMRIPNWQPGSLDRLVGNDAVQFGWLGGIGVRMGRYDFLINNRAVRAAQHNVTGPFTGSFEGISHSAWTASVRIRL